MTQEEQYQIYSYKKAGFANELIAQELDRDVSTIKRKLSRNMGLRGYPPQQAHCLAQQSSPEQIQGLLLDDGLDAACPGCIYKLSGKTR